MKPIPISAAKRIAKDYGYDQVVVYARKVGESPDAHGEHVTTYGIDKEHCSVAARMGDHLKYNVFGWPRPENRTADHDDHSTGGSTIERGLEARPVTNLGRRNESPKPWGSRNFRRNL